MHNAVGIKKRRSGRLSFRSTGNKKTYIRVDVGAGEAGQAATLEVAQSHSHQTSPGGGSVRRNTTVRGVLIFSSRP